MKRQETTAEERKVSGIPSNDRGLVRKKKKDRENGIEEWRNVIDVSCTHVQNNLLICLGRERPVLHL
jgi:hypothetical protein